VVCSLIVSPDYPERDPWMPKDKNLHALLISTQKTVIITTLRKFIGIGGKVPPINNSFKYIMWDLWSLQQYKVWGHLGWEAENEDERSMFFLNIKLPEYTASCNSHVYELLQTGFAFVIWFTAHFNTRLVTTLYSCLQHALSIFSLTFLHQSLLGNDFQQRTFPILSSRTTPCLSYQLLTATAHKNWTAEVL
jgi:hypothetical protein